MDGNNLIWSYEIANTLYDLGVKNVCICPGSRNTPLIIAFTKNKKFNCTSHIDERSAGYYALGVAKKDNSPAILISTSGTAVANFLPAIIESSLSKTPLIVITADRPNYLLNTGENQTINQQNIYGGYVRNFLDVGLPNTNLKTLKKDIITTYNLSIDDIPGPIHINTPFEEPIVGELINNRYSPKEKMESRISKVQDNQKIKIQNLENSIIICGELNPNENIDSILLLSEFLNAPILADPTSNIRYYKSHQNIISSYNLLLKNININPNHIIRFGRKPTSKILCNLISKHSNVLLVDKNKLFNDNPNQFIRANLDEFANNIIQSFNPIDNNSILNTLKNSQKRISNHINSFTIDQMMCEGILIKDILNIVNPNTNLFIGNSMAIREMDDLTININKKINIYSNRGASGIDGLVSTALGISSVSESKDNIAILGDLSFYYDMTSLAFASKSDISLKLFILNNNGGGIFKKLPVSNLNYSQFEKYWITPPNLNLHDISKSLNIKYHEIGELNDLKELFKSSSGLEIIDCKIDMENDYKNKIIRAFLD